MRISLFGMIVGIFSATPAAAQSLFDGRWRPDTSTMQNNAKPTAVLFENGIFNKDSERAEDGVKADGKFHSISGDGYVDEIAIDVIDDHTIREIDKVHGKIVYTVKYIVSQDSNFLTWEVTSFANPDGKPVRSELRQRRVGILSAKSHPISGTWQKIGLTVDGGSADWILKLDGNHFSSWSLQGVGYEAIVGGPAVPIKGDEAGGVAQVTMPSANTVIKTSSLNGIVGGILEMLVLPDGKTMLVTARAPQRKEVSTFYLHKQ